MERNEILSKVDHTLLAQTATWAEIRAICDDGMKYHTASVCIPASYVKQAKDYVGDKLPICTVIGFPNGYDTTKAKCLEALDAVQNGADAVYIATSALMALGCHLCRSCQTGRCNWGIATQNPELVSRLDIEEGKNRLVNLLTAWKHEIKEMMGGMGINSIEALKGNRLMLRGVGMTDKELEILGISHAGE